MIILRPKNIIFERFGPLSKFPACSTLLITYNGAVLVYRIMHGIPNALLINYTNTISTCNPVAFTQNIKRANLARCIGVEILFLF